MIVLVYIGSGITYIFKMPEAPFIFALMSIVLSILSIFTYIKSMIAIKMRELCILTIKSFSEDWLVAWSLRINYFD